MIPAAQLVLNLSGEAEPKLEGWWLADGSVLNGGVAVLVAISPAVVAEAERRGDKGYSNQALKLASALLAVLREITTTVNLN